MNSKLRQLLALAALLCSFVFVPRGHVLCEEMKRCSDLFDPAALKRIRAVCVDTSYLEPASASDVKSYVEMESQPGHLLTRLPWRRDEKCTPDDAVIRVYFEAGERRSPSEPNTAVWPRPSSVETYERGTRVVLLVYDQASVRLLYRTDFVGAWSKRPALLRVPFSRLVKEMSARQR